MASYADEPLFSAVMMKSETEYEKRFGCFYRIKWVAHNVPIDENACIFDTLTQSVATAKSSKNVAAFFTNCSHLVEAG
jgi:archaellum biogenesis ATPase FlaH